MSLKVLKIAFASKFAAIIKFIANTFQQKKKLASTQLSSDKSCMASSFVPDKIEPDDLLYPFDPDFYDLLNDDIPVISDREHLERAWRLTLAAESNPTDFGGS